MICPRNVEHQTRRPATKNEGKETTPEAKLGIITQNIARRKPPTWQRSVTGKGTSDIGSG
jgi:hypothetical protein